MKKLVSLSALALFFFYCSYTDASPTPHDAFKITKETIPHIPASKIIRVLLEEHDADKESKFIIKSRHGFVLESPAASSNTAVYQKEDIHLLCHKKQLYLQCRDHRYRRIKYDSIEICSPQQKLTLGSTTYQGNLIIKIDADTNRVLIINKLPLEDYVYSVVRYESIPSWPLAMQKIQAIISRTYAVFLMQQARAKNPRYPHYDLKNTNLHQVYNGTHTCTHLRQAVDETNNVIVTHKGNVALTMFDICCGGLIPSKMRHKDQWKPYLCRNKPCTFCTHSPSYQWKEDQHINNFLKTLKTSPSLTKKFNNFKGKITDIIITDRDSAGIVHRVKLFDEQKRAVSLTGKNIRNAYPHKIKSLSFSIKKERDRVVISGKGYGHQRGVCQWGCKELVARGWSIKKILEFYYPGATLNKLA